MRPCHVFAVAVGVGLTLVTAHKAGAQEFGATAPSAKAGADTVISANGVVEGDGSSGSVTVDMLGGWRMASSLDLLARPVVYRASDGTWDADLYQLALRYSRPGPVLWRIEAGYLPSPVGIMALEARADQNPVIIPATSYAATLPTFEAGTPAVQLTSANYPLAVQVTSSATHWDLRAAVLGSSPVRVRPLTGDDRPPSAPQLALGGGVTPHIGLRLGASFVHGRYAKASEVGDPSSGDRMATLIGLDADYSVGYTRVYADFVHGRYDRATDAAVATSLTITGVRTVSPRWYLAVRGSRQTTSDMLERPVYGPHDPTGGGGYGGGGDGGNDDGGDGGYGGGSYVHAAVIRNKSEWKDLGAADALNLQAVVGYRLTPDLTLRAGYVGYRAFGSNEVEHGAGFSVVWAHRWH